MTRSRLVMLFFLASAVTFCVAVQRDTFLRRWLLPPPPAERAATEDELTRPAPGFQLSDATLTEAVAELARVSGTKIEVDPALARDFDDLRISMDETDLRVCDVLFKIEAIANRGLTLAILMRREDGFVLRRAADVRKTIAVRMYDMETLLPDVVSPPAWYDSTRPELERMVGRRVYSRLLHEQINGVYRHEHDMPPPTKILNSHFALNRLIVIAPEVDQPEAMSVIRSIRSMMEQSRQEP